MPTATLVTRDGTFVAFLGSSHQQEVNANASITIISPQSKQIHQQRQSELKINTTMKKSSQPDIKPTIQTKKKNIKPSTARTRKICSYEGCTNGVVEGGVCVTHGAKVKRCRLRWMYQLCSKGGSLRNSWRKSSGEAMQL
jgi:hypothetical protein